MPKVPLLGPAFHRMGFLGRNGFRANAVIHSTVTHLYNQDHLTIWVKCQKTETFLFNILQKTGGFFTNAFLIAGLLLWLMT
jgi:hypothetical protein